MKTNLSATLTRRVAVAVVPDMEDGTLAIAFRGATREMVAQSVRWFQGHLCRQIQLKSQRLPFIVNGKCHWQYEITATGIDTQRLAVQEWLLLICNNMKRNYPCEVTFFSDYDKFLNT